jgi:hypothetical protein
MKTYQLNTTIEANSEKVVPILCCWIIIGNKVVHEQSSQVLWRKGLSPRATFATVLNALSRVEDDSRKRRPRTTNY